MHKHVGTLVAGFRVITDEGVIVGFEGPSNVAQCAQRGITYHPIDAS
jgi:hypothetical protein